MSTIAFFSATKNISCHLIRHGFSINATMYTIYEIKITQVVQPIVLEISSSMNARQSQSCQKTAKDLIQIGMQLKAFAFKGMQLFPGREFQILTYNTWFKGGIDQYCKTFASVELLSRFVMWKLFKAPYYLPFVLESTKPSKLITFSHWTKTPIIRLLQSTS